MQFAQLDLPISWLLLHRNGSRYYFELESEHAASCDKKALKDLGFSPKGDNYWLFKIKRELSDNELICNLADDIINKTTKPQIIKL